jgi:hypothetical protein
VLLEDLIAYLFPPSEFNLSPSAHPTPKRLGRPRKSVTSDRWEGGGR